MIGLLWYWRVSCNPSPLIKLLSSPFILIADVFFFFFSSCITADTSAYAYTNCFCAAATLLTAYNLFRAVTLDPGFVPKPASENEVREVRLHLKFARS